MNSGVVIYLKILYNRSLLFLIAEGSNIPYPQIIEQVVEISSRVEYPVLNMLVSLVLDSLAQHDAAALYKRKSIEYLQQ